MDFNPEPILISDIGMACGGPCTEG